jgi:shikimate kinase
MADRQLVERVVLVGFLGAGKSVVGRSLAWRLEWDFIDFDEEIRTRERKPLSRVIDESGGDYFWEAQRALTEEVAGRSQLVIAPGGAWITRPELLDVLGPTTLAVWLKVSPSEAFERIRLSTDDHPWHDHPSPIDRIGDLMRERNSMYRLADLSIPTNWRSPETIAFEIEQTVRTRRSSAADANRSPRS